MQVKTTHVQQIWQSPDGKRTIWEVDLLGDNGNSYTLKTYSPEISKMGWTGEVQSYLNPRGDRFVRQLKPASTGTAAGGGSGSGGYHRDDNAIKAQWAIGQAINLASVKMDKDKITMPVIEEYARELYETVSRVKGDELSDKERAEAREAIRGLTQAPVL